MKGISLSATTSLDLANMKCYLKVYSVTVFYISLVYILSKANLAQHASYMYLSTTVKLQHFSHHKVHDREQPWTGLHPNATQVDNAEVVAQIQTRFLDQPSVLPYNLSHPEVTDHSGGNQAMLVDYLLNSKTGGFFVECGGLDGESRSNTLYLERFRNWTGVLIEADSRNYKNLLSKHRKAYTINTCLSVHKYPSVEKFNPNYSMGKIYKDSFMYKLWTVRNGLKFHPVDVQCFPLYLMMLALARRQIDYLSLDVEGLELDVLKTIPFELLDITVITAEFAHTHGGKKALRLYMEENGYVTIAELKKHTSDYVFVKSSYIKEGGINVEGFKKIINAL